jgi:hypothetical protein
MGCSLAAYTPAAIISAVTSIPGAPALPLDGGAVAGLYSGPCFVKVIILPRRVGQIRESQFWIVTICLSQPDHPRQAVSLDVVDNPALFM